MFNPQNNLHKTLFDRAYTYLHSPRDLRYPFLLDGSLKDFGYFKYLIAGEPIEQNRFDLKIGPREVFEGFSVVLFRYDNGQTQETIATQRLTPLAEYYDDVVGATFRGMNLQIQALFELTFLPK